MKKLIILLVLNLVIGLGTVSAQTTSQDSSMRKGKNDMPKDKDHKTNKRNNNRQDTGRWNRKTDGMTPGVRMQRDTLRNPDGSHRDGMKNSRDNMQKENNSKKQNNMQADSIKKY